MASKRSPAQPTDQGTTPTTVPGSNQSAFETSNPLPSGTPDNSGGQYRSPIGVGYQVNESGNDIAALDDGSGGTTYHHLAPGEQPPAGTKKVIHPGQVMVDKDGVPQPYSAEIQIPGRQTSRSPVPPRSTQTAYQPAQYMEGDEWRIVGGRAKEEIAQIQQAMKDRGLYSSDTPRISPGGWDNDSAAAFKQVLAYANSTGQDWKHALSSMPPIPPEDKTKQVDVTRSHYTVTLSHPDTLAAIFKNAAASLLGGADVPQDMIDSYVRAYQKMQKDDQDKANALTEAAKRDKQTITVDENGNPVAPPPPGTDVLGALPDSAATAAGPNAGGPDLTPVTSVQTETPSPELVAQNMIKQKYPGRYGATQMASAFDKFIPLLGGLTNTGSNQGTPV